MAVNMLGTVKTALRITHSKLDSDISLNIDAATAEMIRAGVRETAAVNMEDPLIQTAIVTYCKASYAKDTNEADKYSESFKYQLENLRKTAFYNAEVPQRGE